MKQNKEDSAISLITYIEVLSFDFSKKDEQNIKELLESFKILEIDKKISIAAIHNRKSRRIKIPDNIIASSAQTNNLILVTRNIKDFDAIDVEILNPFDKALYA